MRVNRFVLAVTVIICSLLSFASCQQESIDSKVQNNNVFNLKSYFLHQISLLDSIKPTINKTVYLNDRKEEKIIKNISWKNELSIFIESDIHKPAWKEKYSVDTLFKNDSTGNTYSLLYKALDQKPKTQFLKIDLEKNSNQIQSIHIRNIVENFLYTSVVELNFIPNEKYDIQAKEKIIFLSADTMNITGIFIR